MHIHANNNLLLASIGAGREEAQEIAAKRAAEMRRKLSNTSRILNGSEELPGVLQRVDRRPYNLEKRQGEDDAFERHFTATA